MLKLVTDEATWNATVAARRAEADADMKMEMRRVFGTLGVPTKDVGPLLEGKIQQTEAIVKLTQAPQGLTVLSGLPGCGKTVAASHWIYGWAMNPQNWDVDATPARLRGRMLWVTAAKLSRWPKYDEEQMRKLLGADRLVIDDMGVEYLDEKGAYLSLLDEVLNARYDGMRPTVMTTNLDAQTFKERYGVRLADRIREVGKFIPVATESMRRK